VAVVVRMPGAASPALTDEVEREIEELKRKVEEAEAASKHLALVDK
jgi:hypothetical protein